MPIIRERYPTNWEKITKIVKQESKWACEQCHRPCRKPNESVEDFSARISSSGWISDLWDGTTIKKQRFTLTVSHVDQNPNNCERTNLRALCSVCHLRFDSKFRARQKRALAEYYGQLSLDEPEECGTQLSVLPNIVRPYALPKKGEAPKEGKFVISEE